MSANLRKKLNQQRQNYAAAVMAALTSDDVTHVDPAVRVLPCPVCGRITACQQHTLQRRARARAPRMPLMSSSEGAS